MEIKINIQTKTFENINDHNETFKNIKNKNKNLKIKYTKIKQ